MAKLIANITTTKFIGSEEIVFAFFDILERANFLPDKISLYEPITTPFSLDKAVGLWILQENGGCEDIGYKCKYGSMLGKKSKPGFLFDMTCWQGPGENLNHITFWVSPTTFTKHKDDILYVFHETFRLVEGIYGYISHEDPKDRQHVTGTLKTRLPGVFWCNYFGKKYIDFFGKERLLSAPWFASDEMDDQTIITYLDESPLSPCVLEDDCLADSIKEAVGKESFGDPAEERRNIIRGKYDVNQVKNVPRLF